VISTAFHKGVCGNALMNPSARPAAALSAAGQRSFQQTFLLANPYTAGARAVFRTFNSATSTAVLNYLLIED
jgi:hypothetical protein